MPIGRPLANSWHRVLDSTLRLQPVGVDGELCLGGDGLAWGYLGRPALTAERFVPDPYAGVSGEAGGRLYRTGDRVRLLDGGEVDFVGRFDDQVKIRGFRIEPGEAAAAVSAAPGVEAAAVVVRQDVPGERRLVGYFVPEDRENPVTEAALREHLETRLPAYLLPSVLIPLENLPLTPNGKVDRKALPAPQDLRAAGEGAYLAPRNPAEELLAGIWSEVLGVPRVGLSDNFFELGGHSLMATRLASRIRKALQVDLPLREVFDHPTLGELAGAVERARREAAGQHIPPIEPRPRDQPLPLSFAQQRLWFLDQLEPGSPAYNMPMPLKARGPLQLAAVEEALGRIVERHEVLRTRFVTREGRPVQSIEAAAPFELPRVDLRGLGEEAREAEAWRLVRQEAVRPFDLEEGGLIRVSVLLLAPEEHWILANLHHIVTDGWSMGILVGEVSHFYRRALGETPEPLPELPV
ncbi:MAG: AMP-binding protein, partial [Acidobacteria bacterium]|nr:AMP-binding protein [Acidobacteriota bacterium]